MAVQGLFTHEAPLDIVSYLLVDQISRIPHANSTLNGGSSMLLRERNLVCSAARKHCCMGYALMLMKSKANVGLKIAKEPLLRSKLL